MYKNYKETTKNILLTLFTIGAITVAATSPYFLINIARAIRKNKRYIKKEIEERKIARALDRLKNNRLIIICEKEGKFIVELTDKGRRKIKEIQLDNMKIEKPVTWDRKWRVVVFDIPDKYKKRARDALREKLQRMKFYRLQKSVWVNPYPCEKEIHFLCKLFGITPFVNIIIADNIYNDIKLRKYFGLF